MNRREFASGLLLLTGAGVAGSILPLTACSYTGTADSANQTATLQSLLETDIFAFTGDPAPLADSGLFPTGQLPSVPRDGAVARFAVLSDTHSAYYGQLSAAKMRRIYQGLSMASPDLDACLVLGDLVCYNTDEERQSAASELIRPLMELFPSRPPLHLLLGNHDRYNDFSTEQFEEYYGRALAGYLGGSQGGHGGHDDQAGSQAGEPGDITPESATAYDYDAQVDYGQKQNTLIFIQGVPIIKLCPAATGMFNDYRYLYDFLNSSLAQARQANNDANKPIFVLAHHPSGSSWLAAKDDVGLFGEGEDSDLIALMSSYPEVVFISGHTHTPANLASAISQDAGFTSIHAPTACAQYWVNFQRLGKTAQMGDENYSPEQLMAQGLLVDVFTDGQVRVSRLDFCTPQVLEPAWRFKPGASVTEPVYLVAARKQSVAVPKFQLLPNNQELTVLATTTVVTVQFPMPTTFAQNPDSFAYRYKLLLWDSDTGTLACEKWWYESFFCGTDLATHRQRFFFAGSGNYRAELVAYNSFDQPSIALTADSTPAPALAGWQQFDDGLRYFNPDDGAVAYGWAKVENRDCYFDQTTGCLQTGWAFDGSYLVDCKLLGMATTGWDVFSGYRNPSPKLLGGDGKTGWQHSGFVWSYYKGELDNLDPEAGPDTGS